MDLSQDQKSALKLAQIVECCNSSNCTEVFQNILEKDGDINAAIPENYLKRWGKECLSNSTALHFAYEKKKFDFLIKLLNFGADFTIQNNSNRTVLHMMIEDLKKINRPLGVPSINAVLSAHLTTENFSNPFDNRGLSHFHIACMTENTTAIQFFLDNGVSVDEPININTNLLPGFTPLHLAAMCTNNTVAELLLRNGANLHALDSSGMSVLHVLIKRRIEMFDSIGETLNAAVGSYDQLQQQIKDNEMIINILMEKMSSDNDCLDHIGLSNFQVSCMLQDTSIALHLVDNITDFDHSLNADSVLWPGYTALHFAAHVSLDNVEMLVKKGANLGKPDAAGITPLDICIERYKIEDICRIMSLNADWVKITFSDDTTKLTSFLHTFMNPVEFKRLINRPNYDMNMFIPMESPLWPGFTPLHLAVRFADKSNPMFKEDDNKLDFRILKLCLKNGSDLSAQDSRGRTAFHLAFRLEKMPVVSLIRKNCEIPNSYDEDNLSHLHIVCAMSRGKKTIRKCIIDDSNVNAVYRGTSPILNVRPGSTPLHACFVTSWYMTFPLIKMKQLLSYKINPDIRDAYGLTPIHWLLNIDSTWRIEVNPLLEIISEDCVAEEYGLSYLHVAVHMKDIKAVKRLLENGANVNAMIRYSERNSESPLFFLSKFNKQTPLNMTPTNLNNIRKLLIDYGADVYLEIVSHLSKDTRTWELSHSILKILWNNIKLRTLIRREFGWTRLHLACSLFHMLNLNLESIVRAELADVNARIYSNSTFCRGYTPLHLLLQNDSYRIQIQNKVTTALNILLKNGADVTLGDDEQNTPITMLYRHSVYKAEYKRAAFLMKHHRDFNVNPVNRQGISHFHVACWLSDVDAVKGFLTHGVEVNRQIDCFSEESPGCTALHLASHVQIVDLLMNHGADINIENVNGRTVIYKAIKLDESILTRLIKSGASINGLNHKGETPIEVALSEHSLNTNKREFLIQQGFIVNSCNPITGVGYIAIAINKYYLSNNLHQQPIVEFIMNEESTNKFGRTTLHCLVTRESFRPSVYDYVILIEKLIESGCDIDGQDIDGKTAIHLAVKFESTRIMRALLACGADINISDKIGNSALSDAINLSRNSRIDSRAEILLEHTCRLAFLKLDLSHINKAAISEVQKFIQDNATNENFLLQIDTAKAIELGVRSMRLSDFLSETGADAIYRLLTKLERSKIDEYFESIHNDDRVKDIKGFLKLQYRKAVKRLELHSSAIRSLFSVLRLDLPYLCAENIIKYLSNMDLQNIISARIENEDSDMDVD